MHFCPSVLILGLSALLLPGFDIPRTATSAAPVAEPSTETLRDLARRGDAGAAHDLGERYEHGTHGLGRDLKEAAQWYQLAAEGGDHRAMADLGTFLINGQAGLAQDDPKAFRYFLKAAEHQHPYATHMVAWMFEVGRGTPKNDAEAAAWYRKAADLGSMDALTQLAWMTELGRGVIKNEQEAARMYAVAARGGNAQAMNNLGWFFVQGTGGLAKNYAAAKELFELASSLGNARADGNLGYLYQQGLGVTRNLSTAMQKFRTSAEAGDLLSQRHLSQVYLTGQDLPRDTIQAFHYARLAAAHGDDHDLQRLGVFLLNAFPYAAEDSEALYRALAQDDQEGRGRSRALWIAVLLRGLGGPVDKAKAEALIQAEMATEIPNPLLVPMARSLIQGGGFPRMPSLGRRILERLVTKGSPQARLLLAKDLIQRGSETSALGVKTLQELSDTGDLRATFELGLLHQNGTGVKPSSRRALELFNKAAEGGLPEAMFHLGVAHQSGLLGPKRPKEAAEWYRRAEAAGWPEARGRVQPDGRLRPL